MLLTFLWLLNRENILVSSSWVSFFTFSLFVVSFLHRPSKKRKNEDEDEEMIEILSRVEHGVHLFEKGLFKISTVDTEEV